VIGSPSFWNLKFSNDFQFQYIISFCATTKSEGVQSKRHRVPSPPPFPRRSSFEYLCVPQRSECVGVCGVSFVDAVANGCIDIRMRKK